MNYPDIPRASSGPLPSQKNRAFRLKWADTQRELEPLLLPQRIEIREELCGGIEGHICCVSTSIGIPLETFIGVPLAVQLVTGGGELRTVSGIVTDAHEGESDSSLATYKLTIRDAMSILDRRVNTRIFREKSVPDIVWTLISEWRNRSVTLGCAFDLDFSMLDLKRYPPREQTIQFAESDAHFAERLCRREGIAWYFQAGKPGPNGAQSNNGTAHSLVLFDDGRRLSPCRAAVVPYRSSTAIGNQDAVTLLAAARQIVPGAVRHVSWDPESARTDHVQGPTQVDQGKAGNDLARLLLDARIDSPHFADSWDDYERLGMARVQAHRRRAAHWEGVSGERDLTVGQWFEVSGHPQLDSRPEHARRLIVTRVHHRGENNLPKKLNERAVALFAANRWHFDAPPVSVDTSRREAAFDGSAESRYENSFTCVTRGTPLTPAYDPRVHLPRVYPVTGLVVGPQGEEVFCDKDSRIRVQMQGLREEDHVHARWRGHERHAHG